MKTIINFITALLFFSSLSGQEFNLPLSNQYLADNDFIISSSFAGIGDCWQIRANGVAQWVGIDDSPNTQSVSIDGRIGTQSGVGAILFNDSNGFTSQRGVQASFAHHINMSSRRRAFLSFGINFKYTQFSIATSDFEGSIFDPSLEGDINSNNLNVDASFLYRHEGFFFSFNANNLAKKNITEFNPQEPNNISNYYIYSGYKFKERRKKLGFEPSVFFQKFGGDTRSTLDLNLKIKKETTRESYMWAGVSTRFINDQGFKPLYLSPMVGVKLGQLYAAYGYQVNVNEISGYNSGTHMITLGFDFACAIGPCDCTSMY